MTKNTNKIIAVDIGNTSVSLGVMNGVAVKCVYRLASKNPPARFKQDIRRILAQIRKEYPLYEKVVICSVVPSVLKQLEYFIKQYFSQAAFVIGRDIQVPIKNQYRSPQQVGQDRLVAAYAAQSLYGSPTIVIDLGTAITLEVVSHKGEYKGGVILPGIEISAEALFQKTALLPHIDVIQGPRNLIGKDTEESILSGIFFGYGTMCRGLIDLLAKKVKGTPCVVMTGGYALVMKRFIKGREMTVEPHLVLKGIQMVYTASQ
jgi:type III pantothenate kinase